MSLSSTTSWLTIDGSIVRSACGSRIVTITCDLRIPRANAASLWPRGTALTPARNTSARTDPLYSISPSANDHSFSLPSVKP